MHCNYILIICLPGKKVCRNWIDGSKGLGLEFFNKFCYSPYNCNSAPSLNPVSLLRLFTLFTIVVC